MVKFLIVVVLIVLAVFVYLTLDKPMFESDGKLIIGFKPIDVEIAETSQEQFAGLSGRDSLCDDCGMVFLYSQARIQKFTMRGMKFPLDIIFIRDGRITEMVQNVPFPQPGELPVNINSRDPADMVLEVNAGFVQRNSVPTSQTIRLER